MGKKTSSNTQGKGEVSRAATELLGHLLPCPSSEKGGGSQLEGETTLTPSPPEAGLIHYCRQLITQEDCFL